MTPELERLRFVMSQRDQLRGATVGFDIAKARRELSLLRHVDLAQEDLLELIAITDWLMGVIEQTDSFGRIGPVRRRPDHG